MLLLKGFLEVVWHDSHIGVTITNMIINVSVALNSREYDLHATRKTEIEEGMGHHRH